METLSPNLYLVRDTCNVYIIRSSAEAVLVDFGSGGAFGAAFDCLSALGVRRVTDILITHHHRDQAQGLAQALAGAPASLAGARVWAPHNEQDFFHSVDQLWQAHSLLNNYDVRQDRFSLLEPVALSGTLQDYATYIFGGRQWKVLPAPGHTPGSLALLVEIDGRQVAFTGDLIAGPGKVWSMAALQWSYWGMEGAAASVLSLSDLQNQSVDWLLPSHGEVITDPASAIELLSARLLRLLETRRENPNLTNWMREPYERVTSHLLLNRTSVSNSYVLISESGKALLIDYGYDFLTRFFTGTDRSLHRPWLYSLPALKRDFGVQKIDVAIATHYHDDHVAGFNLLRDAEGCQVWAAETFADILARPSCYDLPCLWYDPIPVDRALPLGQEITWEEYRLVLYPLPGHTRYAVAIAFKVDGRRVLATGDQYAGEEGLIENYVFQNRFAIEDFRASAELYARLAPDLILPGHWKPLATSAGYFRRLREQADGLVNLYQDLLLDEAVDSGGDGFCARVHPYHLRGKGGEPIECRIEVRNPLHCAADLRIRLVLPEGWRSTEGLQILNLGAGEASEVIFQILPPPGCRGRRFRLAVDLFANDVSLGQQAEALIDLM